jgi:hypothetical protein
LVPAYADPSATISIVEMIRVVLHAPGLDARPQTRPSPTTTTYTVDVGAPPFSVQYVVFRLLIGKDIDGPASAPVLWRDG